jgi:outer membrane protein assembly factor BamE (lipoprotein component of BamABCDE complex)
MNYKKAFFLFLLTSCITTNKGKLFDGGDLEQLDTGITNKNNVIKMLGYPSFVLNLDNNKWVYYSYKIRKFLFFKPDLKEQKILVLDFENEILKNLSLYDVDSNNYEPLENSNYNLEEEKNIIKDIFSNIGQIKQ